VATLLDYRFRVANDLANLHAASNGDRDPKENAWTILVPKHLEGSRRELAAARAIATVRRVADRIGGCLERELERLSGLWPSVARWIRRGILVGRRVYEIGHYSSLPASSMRRIADELDGSLPVSA
jgi:hypothetical protein